MTIPIARNDCTIEELHRLAGMCKDVRQSRRFRALAMVLDGVCRSEVAAAQGTTVQSIRDWILRFNAHGPDGLADDPRTGRPCRLSESEKREVALWIEEGPDTEEDGVSRWRLIDLRDKVLLRFNEYFSLEGIRRVIRSLGFVKISPRPVHPKADPVKQEEFCRDFNELVLNVVPEGTEPVMIDIWFQDEARAGQKGMLSRVWARKGSRPRIVRDHRYSYAYLFAAACPERSVAVGHICDRANTVEMNRHLADISDAVPTGRHAVIVLDGAGWHRSNDLEIPANISLLRLPPYSPELNSMENVFAFLKGNFLSNQVFSLADDVRSAIANAWYSFVSDPDRIKSITSRAWAACTG